MFFMIRPAGNIDILYVGKCRNVKIENHLSLWAAKPVSCANDYKLRELGIKKIIDMQRHLYYDTL